MRNTSRTYFAYSLFALCISPMLCCCDLLSTAALTNWLNDHYMTPCVCMFTYFIYLVFLTRFSFLKILHLSMWDNNILRFYEFIVFKLKFPCLSLLLLLVVPAYMFKTCNVDIMDLCSAEKEKVEARKNLKLKTWWPKKCCCHNLKGHNNIIHEHKRSGAKVSCHILCNTNKKKVKREREIVDWKRSQNCDNRWEALLQKKNFFLLSLSWFFFLAFFFILKTYVTPRMIHFFTHKYAHYLPLFFPVMTFPSPQYVCGIKFIFLW